MNYSESIIKKTIDYINSLAITDEKKQYYNEYLSSNDSNKINELVDKETLFMFTTPLVLELYTNEKYVVDLMKLLSMEPKFIEIEYIDSIGKQIDLKKLFNQQCIIDFLCDKFSVERYLAIDKIMECLDEKDRNKCVDIYLEKTDVKELYQLSGIADCCFDYAFNSLSKEKQEDVKNKFIYKYYTTLSPYVENYLFEKVKDKLDILSLNEKASFVNSMKSIEVGKKIFEYFEFDKNIDLIINNFYLEPTKYISQDALFKKFCELVELNKYDVYLKHLTPEMQVEAIKVLDENNIPFFKYKSLIKTKALSAVYDEKPNFLDIYEIYNLYKESGDIKYLEGLKERFFKTNEFSLDVLCEDEFINLLTDEEKEHIIKNIESDTDANITVPSYVKNFNDYFFRIYNRKKISLLDEKPDAQVHISLYSLADIYTDEEELKLIKHIRLSDIVETAVDSEKCYDELMKLLDKDKDLLRGIPDYPSNGKMYLTYYEEKMLRLDNLLNYIDEKDYYLLISAVTVKNPKLKEYFIKNCDSKPQMVSDIELLDLLDEDKVIKVLDVVDIKVLKSFSDSLLNKNDNIKNKEYIISAIENRLDEFIEYTNLLNWFNYNKEEDNVYFYLNDEYKKLYLEKSKMINSLGKILVLTNPYDENIINRMLEIYTKTNIDSFNVDPSAPNKQMPFSNMDKNLREYVISKMDFNQLLYTFTYYSDKFILNKLLNKIHEDNTCLINESVIRNINVLLYYSSNEEKNYIYNSVSSMLNSNELYINKYKDKIKDINIKDSINFLNLYNKGYIENNVELFDILLENNPFLLKSVKGIIFNDKIKTLDLYFLNKVSKYSDLQEKLKALSFDENKFNLFYECAKYLENTIKNKVVFDKEISKIIEFISYDKSFKDEDLKNINYDNIQDIINYILCNYINCLSFRIKSEYPTVCEKYDIKLNNFTENKNEKCDELFKKELDVNNMKNIYLNKYFSLSLTEAKIFYQSYVMNYEKVLGYAESELPLLFVDLLTKILKIEDPVTLRELYDTNNIYFELSDIYEIESIMSHAYFLALSNDYKNKQNGTIIHKSIKDKDGNIKEYEMTELEENFGIIVHSTCAYGEMPLINDDYYDSWNYNPNTENHGICCSYITNSSYGTAAVTGNGVMLGFTNITPETVVAYSPYDLATRNNGFIINCGYTPYCTRLDDMDDYTRHTHNEVNLERRVSDGSNFCLQPDCIIIFEDMDDDIKANSIKAYNDFKKHNPDMKLIYIDRVKLATNESCKLDDMMIEYRKTNDLDILKEIINKYESNICCTDFLSIGKENSVELFDTDVMFKSIMVTNLLIDTLNDIAATKDRERFNYFVAILEHEQFKFNLIDDKNPDRKHIFKLYSNEIKAKIQETMNILNEENTKII